MTKEISEFRLQLSSRFCQDMGISDRISDEQLIVSLTSYIPRFGKLHLTLESLLNQAKKPDKICLWISKNEMTELPANVKRLTKRGVTILPCDDLRSYKKIVFAVQEYPDAIIVTADDDVIYPQNWLSTLYNAHLEDRTTIICHRAKLMIYDQYGILNSYNLWPKITTEHKSELVFPTGVGGVLYPPGSLSDQVTDTDSFMTLCPHNDDIWLKVMSLLTGRECRRINVFPKHLQEVEGTKEVSLYKINVLGGRNDTQIEDTFKKYDVSNILTNWKEK